MASQGVLQRLGIGSQEFRLILRCGLVHIALVWDVAEGAKP